MGKMKFDFDLIAIQLDRVNDFMKALAQSANFAVYMSESLQEHSVPRPNSRSKPYRTIQKTMSHIDVLIPALEDLKSELTLLLNGDSCG